MTQLVLLQLLWQAIHCTDIQRQCVQRAFTLHILYAYTAHPRTTKHFMPVVRHRDAALQRVVRDNGRAQARASIFGRA